MSRDFAYLQNLPVTYVKIAAAPCAISHRPASDVIVRLARLRNIECISEWFESEEVIARLRMLSVRYAKGY